ncbi:MAG: hypothetical protein KIT84_42855 [Labilithrix sp.]|nr:hypothetical protein [Labilithrix sp.]
MRLMDGRPIATTRAAVRTVSRVVLSQGEDRGLLAHGLADDHLHAVLAASRPAVGDFARYVEIALGRLLGLGSRFQSAHIVPLQNQDHALRTFHYVQRQDARHGLDRDPMREGTSLPDMLAIRLVGSSIAERVREHLPRLRPEHLMQHFPAGAFVERPIDLRVLADAAAAVFALPDLRGRGDELARARRAAVHVAGKEVPTRALSEVLEIGARAVQMLRALPPELVVVRAVKLQALLRTQAKKLNEVG